MAEMNLRQRRPSFTLIELLVVIAIIAILASLLLPALQKAQRSTENTGCVSTMQQIGYAAQCYMDENNDTLPGNIFSTQGPYYDWDPRRFQRKLQAYLYVPTTGWGTNPFPGYSKLYECPGWRKTFNPTAYGSNPFNSCYNMNFSTGISGLWGGNASVTGTGDAPPKKITAIPTYSLNTMWMMRDRDFTAGESHRIWRNALFFDMHVGRLNLVNNPL